jgi:hypothetical protein
MKYKNLLPGILLFAISCVISLCTYTQYGVGWDEPTQREIGYISHDYAFKGDTSLNSFFGKYHGVGFEVPLIMLEQATGKTDMRDIFLQRHIVSHIFFLIGVFCAYLLFLRLFKNPVIASLGFLILAYHPRIYLQSFINTKDLPFLTTIIIAMLVAHLAFEKRKTYWFILLAIVCGYSASIRVLGIILLALISTFLLIDILSSIYKKQPVRKHIIHLLTFFCLFWITLYATWPLLWQAPFTRFAEAMQMFSKYIWDGKMLFMGKEMLSTQLPWKYLPVWFAITMPLLWLIMGIGGTAWLIISAIKNPISYLTNTHKRNYLLYLGLLFIPVFMVIVLKAVVYDGWRHVFFIYPSFVIMALYPLYKLWDSKLRYPLLILFTAQLIQVTIFMYKSFPLQYLFFNRLVPKEEEYIRKSYEFDYWGLSFRQGLEYIDAAEQDKEVIRIRMVTDPIELRPVMFNSYMLQPEKRKRFEFIYTDYGAHYIMVNYRFHPQDYEIGTPVYSIKMMNSTVMTVYKLPDSLSEH